MLVTALQLAEPNWPNIFFFKIQISRATPALPLVFISLTRHSEP